MSLSVCIITRNEEANLPRCLESVAGLAAQVVVVDSHSTDATQAIARRAGAEVLVRPFEGHVKQKQFALEQAREPWVLCLDADEWLDDELRGAIAGIVGGPGGDATAPVGYFVDRRTSYLGAWIAHGGWSPQWRLRLVRSGRARWTGVDPHDRLEADGPTARLPGHLDHLPYRDISEHLDKINRYTDIMVDRRWAAGERAGLSQVLLRPPARFARMWILQGGWRDGWRGLLLATLGGVYVFLKYAKLLARRRGGPPPA